jgi:hypothetical protein
VYERVSIPQYPRLAEYMIVSLEIDATPWIGLVLIVLIVRISPLSLSISFVSTVIPVRVDPVIVMLSFVATGIVFGKVVTIVVHDPVHTAFDTVRIYGVSMVGEMILDPIFGAAVPHGASVADTAFAPVHSIFAEVPIRTLGLEAVIVQLGRG